MMLSTMPIYPIIKPKRKRLISKYNSIIIKEMDFVRKLGFFSLNKISFRYFTVLTQIHVSIRIIKMIENKFNILKMLKAMTQFKPSKP
jgi:hypothetical protein